MTISATQPISAAAAAPSGQYAQIINLQRQAQSLQKEISEENRSDDDAQTKAQVVQRLQAHLQAIRAQIQQLQAAKKNQTSGDSPTQSPAGDARRKDPEAPFAYA